MRKLILSMQLSLDGFIASSDGDSSWMQTNNTEDWQGVFGMLQSVDLMLLGRVMFPEYRDYWKQALTNPKATANEVAYARLADKTKHIVFSGTMNDPGWENTEIVKGRPEEEVARLKKLPGKDIYLVGGAKLAATLIGAGLVDEYRLNINPTILGSGKSFFREQHVKHTLELISTETLKSGVVIAKYATK